MNVANRDINKLAYMSPVTVTTLLGGLPWAGGMERVSPGMAEWLRVKRMAWRSAADCSFGSGSSLEWTSMTKAELTAENRPAYEEEVRESLGINDKQRTKISVVLRSSSYFLTYSVSYSVASFLYIA